MLLFAVQMDGGEYLYPSFQFAKDGTTAPHLMEAIETFRTALPDVWPQCQWVNTSTKDLARISAAQLLASDDPPDYERDEVRKE